MNGNTVSMLEACFAIIFASVLIAIFRLAYLFYAKPSPEFFYVNRKDTNPFDVQTWAQVTDVREGWVQYEKVLRAPNGKKKFDSDQYESCPLIVFHQTYKRTKEKVNVD